MIEFIKTRFYDLPEDADIQSAYEEFEKERERAELEEFAYANGLDFVVINDIMTDYIFNGNITDDAIRKRLADYHFGLLKITKLTGDIKAFVSNTYQKYRAEGE